MSRFELGKYSQLKFGLMLAVGASVAVALCAQCVRTYFYIDAVLVPQQAEREAERQVGALTTAARSAGVTETRALSPIVKRALESSSDHVLWIRILDTENHLLAQGGKSEGTAKVPPRWWEHVETHETLGTVANTAQGKAFVAMLPFRLPRPPHSFDAKPERPSFASPPGGHRAPAYIIQLAIPLKAVTGTFEGLRQNLVVGVIASLALLVSLSIIAMRAPHYFRGKYLENELQLARRVQNDLQPKPESLSPLIHFAATSVAADHVGGDFYDVFEAEPGKITIVLGDVSGKGIPAALLVSVLQGAIRSSLSFAHEHACERINRMLCERSACERYATLFWGVFDPAAGRLRYVNAGHAPPFLLRHGQNTMERLAQGGPVLGLLPNARYSAGVAQIKSADTLVLYSDGISEATDQNEEEFGEQRIEQIIIADQKALPSEICERILNQVTAFASTDAPPDDRTLLIIRFPQVGNSAREQQSEYVSAAVAASCG